MGVTKGVIRAVLVEDHSVLREALRQLLENHGRVSVVGEAGGAEQAFELASHLEVDLFIVDISLPGADGISLVSRLSEHNPDLPVLVLSMHEDEDSVVRAMEAGAKGYITKSATTPELLSCVYEVAAGRSYLHPSVAAKVLKNLRTRGTREHPLPGGEALTDREQQILGLAAQGLRTRDLAHHLRLSVSTVKTHLSAVYRKLGVRDRTQAVVYALDNGLVETTREEPASPDS